MSERPQLNVRVSKSAKEQYEQEILDEYGFTESYAGFELEKELRYALGMGKEGEMYDSLREFVDEPPEKKYSKEPDFTGEDTVVQYRIHPEVKSKLKEDTQGTTTTQKGLVESVMAHYILGEGYQDRMCDRIVNLEEDGVQDDDLPATERKERDIAEYLNGNFEIDGFIEVSQFDEAVREATDLKTMSHAREQYLEGVMGRLGVSINPRKLPNDARNRSQKKAVVKAKVIEEPINHGTNAHGHIKISGVIDELGKTTKQEARSLMKEIGNTPGFSFLEPKSHTVLRLDDLESVKDAKYAHETALELAGLLEEDDVQEGAQNDYAEATTQSGGAIAD